MAPSTKKLEEALINGTCQVYNTDPDATSVNRIRKHVEEELGLDDGFFNSDKWKKRSKDLIKEQVEKLLDEAETESKNGVKRQSSVADSPDAESRKAKRQKRASAVGATEKTSADSDVETETKQKPKKASETAKKSKAKKSQESQKKKGSKLEEESEEVPQPTEQSDSETAEKPDVAMADADALDSLDNELNKVKDDENEENEKGVDTIPSPTVDEPAPEIIEEDEYSDVIDEPAPTKRKKKEAKEKKEPSSKVPKSSSKKAAAVDDPNDIEIKKLQSQLTKCGVRKLWHNELKHCGDDPKAKIRHLKKMLAEIGMTGRFSEARAREIKEMRELAADAEDAQKMNALWGMNSGKRSSRSKASEAKSQLKEDSGSEDDNENEEGEEEGTEEQNSFAARRRRAHAELAFLGDDSDSD